tara:strand:+ start:155 stop:433 length:279 start_codon:yes stop_codon:yes gene_type:complete
MKPFKQYINENTSYPPVYKKNKILMALVKKHKDPLKFLLSVMTAMSAGKLKLSRIGVANTREVAALWNEYHKDKKISRNMIEDFIIHETGLE